MANQQSLQMSQHNQEHDRDKHKQQQENQQVI